ncbi:HD domain-containing phosphohydrolase [Paraburkholderia sp. DHOC27]|uniref:HD domain-containing phosphohydrolase n=1 Tax=Paraburkholderia sp. DHOC27 TaxID=2303330 RepID=UPI000E3ECE79|nr:HD domain-containing phosphohydrolase [Paraburkholderia sp. DHOC27]RFU48958.1 LuxR family transcriptional regulator [Paraburkholderia sp. DHOC27]
MQDIDSGVNAYDAVKALAFIGDLSMGQPTDHSVRTAWLAFQLARALDFDAGGCDTVREASLLRWSGCTANAAGFADAFGDDIASREAMLAQRPSWPELLARQSDPALAITPLAQIHCEVSGEVARMLSLSDQTQATLRHIFEAWDGSGFPEHLLAQSVPHTVFVIALAGDLEVFNRVYGVEQALQLIGQRVDSRYPAAFVAQANSHAAAWLKELDRTDAAGLDDALATTPLQRATPPELIADIIDLKLPWMTGYSREVAATAAQCCARLTPDPQAANLVYQAGLIHGIGRAAVPNAIWNEPGQLSASEWEKVRLVPYWTARAGKQTGTLKQAAELASYAYERLDETGYFRSSGAAGMPLEARILAAAVAAVALRAPRPWRAALSPADAAALLREQAANGRFDPQVVDALLASEGSPPARACMPQKVRLSARETDVLRLISHGASNKDAAKELALSPSTVRTHVESLFRKLECSTRAAATLKAASMGLL